MRIAYIMRGIPGSGKSTWVEDFAIKPVEATCVASADDYHMVDGVYRFDPKNARTAHNECRKKFINAATQYMRNDDATIIVSNTNVKVWELAPYVAIAEAFDYDVRIIRMFCDPFVAHSRNVHGVPIETVWRMHNEMENLPSIWTELSMLTSTF